MKAQHNTPASQNPSLNSENDRNELANEPNQFNLNANLGQKAGANTHHLINPMDRSLQKPVQKTDENLDLLLSNAEEVDGRTKELMLKNRSLIEKLFPSSMDKLIEQMQKNTIQASMEFRLKLYNISTQFRLEALREKYNAALMTIRGHYREQVSEFMMGKLMELHQKVDLKQRGFIELSKSKYEFAKQQQGHQNIQALYMNLIDQEFVGFMTFLNRQVTNFESIIDEQIEKFS